MLGGSVARQNYPQYYCYRRRYPSTPHIHPQYTGLHYCCQPSTTWQYKNNKLKLLIPLPTKARFPPKGNRLRCVRCVWMETRLNESACVGKQPVMVATASTEHLIGCCLLLAANRMLSRSSGNHDWLLSNASTCV